MPKKLSSKEMDSLANEFGTVTAMFTFCKATGTNPKKYIKRAQVILEILRRNQYEYISYSEHRFEEKLAELK